MLPKQTKTLFTVLLITFTAAAPASLVVLWDRLNWEPAMLPGVFFRNHIVELGTVDFGQRVLASFEILNKTSGDLLVESIRSESGCWAAMQDIVRPGERANIQVTVDSMSLGAGPFFRQTRLVLRSGSKSATEHLMLKGRVDTGGFLSVFPSALDFGNQKLGASQEKTLYVYGGRTLLDQLPQSLDLTRQQNRKIVLQRAVKDDQISVKAIRLAFGDNTSGEGKTSVNILISDKKDSKQINIPVFWRSLAVPFVEPSAFYMAVWSDSDTTSVSFELCGLGTFELSSISSDFPAKLPEEWETCIDAPYELARSLGRKARCIDGQDLNTCGIKIVYEGWGCVGQVLSRDPKRVPTCEPGYDLCPKDYV